MLEPIVVRPDVVVPASALSMRAVRASGPGGQNVNKVSSKVELRVDVMRIEGMDAAARARLLSACRTSLDADGQLLVTSQRTRDQRQHTVDIELRRRKSVFGLEAFPQRVQRAGPDVTVDDTEREKCEFCETEAARTSFEVPSFEVSTDLRDLKRLRPTQYLAAFDLGISASVRPFARPIPRA